MHTPCAWNFSNTFSVYHGKQKVFEKFQYLVLFRAREGEGSEEESQFHLGYFIACQSKLSNNHFITKPLAN